MITGPRSAFEARCRERGYTLEQVRPCILSEQGHLITVDESHPAYPNLRLAAAGGPGTELKQLLAAVGIASKPTCPCNAHAAQMDRWGPDECERRMEEIVGWLGEEASRRRLPFVRSAARQIVKIAVRRARKAAAK